MWNKILDEAAADKVGYWIKDRYFHNFGIRIKNMDKAVPALSDIELNALLQYCQSLDRSLLEIPFYEVFNPVLQECDVPEDSHQPWPRQSKDPKSNDVCQGVKLAGLTKRGMAQPSNKRR